MVVTSVTHAPIQTLMIPFHTSTIASRFFLLIVLAFPMSHLNAQDLTLESIHHSSVFNPKYVSLGTWADEGPEMISVRPHDDGSTSIIRTNVLTGEETVEIDGQDLRHPDVDAPLRIEGYAYASEDHLVLLYTDSERVWRTNSKGYYYLLDLRDRSVRPIADREAGFQMFAKFDPSASRVAFVRDRNIFIRDLDEDVEVAVTTNGAPGTIINGTFDWVYEEEFGIRDGIAWSPDGHHLAFFQLDESATRNFQMADLRGQYPSMTTFRYPKAGESNSEVRIGLYDVSTAETRWLDTGTWTTETEWEYVPRMGWTTTATGESRVWVMRMNRDQNHLQLLWADPTTGQLELILEEREDTWIDLRSAKLTFLDGGTHFLWLSDQSGYSHVYLYAVDGTLVRPVTSGAFDVESFLGLDDAGGYAYFTASFEPRHETHLYRVNTARLTARRRPGVGAPEKITTVPGTHRVNVSSDFQYFIDVFTTQQTPPVTSLHKITGETLLVLEDNAALKSRVDALGLRVPSFMSVPSADPDVMLDAYVIRPASFDSTVAYPMLLHIYGGPDSRQVTDAWGGARYLWHQYLANELNMVVSVVDNRGTGRRGKAFTSATYRQLGVLEAADQIAAAQWFGSQSWVDEARIGIWGWSYGGYMTLVSMLMGEGPETFKVGLSIAPVTDWRQYDTIYTERYMSTPQSNPDGYAAGAPLNYADRLADSQRLLLVHGDLDDNVHLQNTTQMSDALIQANRPFDLMIYPGRNHGIYGGNVRLHLHTLLTNYLREHLID